MTDHPAALSHEERDGLTFWGDTINTQFREAGKLAIYIREDAPRDVDGVVLVSANDVARLHALIEEAESRP